MVALPGPDFVPAEARALAEAFAAQPQWECVGTIPFQVSIALHALAEDLGTTVGVALAVALWASPGFPGRCLTELERWIQGEGASDVRAGHLEPEDLDRLAKAAVKLGRVL